MNEVIENPYEYEKPEWLILKIREERRVKREKKLGRTVGKWGGHRTGAGRPRVRSYDFMVGISMTNVQKLMLLEMGKGNLAEGVNALIKEYL
mgnify:CR=1 FL=1|tara:strand:+ start:769 stop:1044 length:276 start_codon:yes stop_codon:yes gene_type:complete